MRVHQGCGVAGWEVISFSEKTPPPKLQRYGFRTGREARCHQSTEISHPFARGRWFPGRDEAISRPLLGQLRGETGVSATPSGSPTATPRPAVFSSSIRPQIVPGVLPIVDGIEPYVKDKQSENKIKTLKGTTATPRTRRTRWMDEAQKSVRNEASRGRGG